MDRLVAAALCVSPGFPNSAQSAAANVPMSTRVIVTARAVFIPDPECFRCAFTEPAPDRFVESASVLPVLAWVSAGLWDAEPVAMEPPRVDGVRGVEPSFPASDPDAGVREGGPESAPERGMNETPSASDRSSTKSMQEG